MNQEALQNARLNHWAGLIHQRVSAFCNGRRCDRSTVERVRDMVQDMREIARLRDGVMIPPMHVIVFPKCGAVEIVRKDMEEAGLNIWIVNLTVKYPTITPQEIAGALKAAFPDYSFNPEGRRQ